MVSETKPETTLEALARRVGCHGIPFLVIAQESTLEAFHDTVAVPPTATRVGRALIETVGTCEVGEGCGEKVA